MAPPPFEEPDPEPPQLATQWRAAGVLPYAVLDGTVLCMLGKEYLLAPSTTRLLPSGVREQQPDMEAASTSAATEPQYRCWWSDFGGGREPEDASVVHTAAREWAEETVGVYGDGSSLLSRVENSAQTMLAQLCETNAPGSSASLGPTFAVVGESYTMYACAVPFVDTLIFQLARDENDAEANASIGRSTTGITPVDEEDMRKLRRRCGEKRDFAWVSLESLLAAVGSGRTWFRDVDGQTITLLPRLGYALQSSGPALLKEISARLLGSSPGSCAGAPVTVPAGTADRVYSQRRGITVLSLPVRRVGGCSLYLSVRRRRWTTEPQVLGSSADSHADSEAQPGREYATGNGTDRTPANAPAAVHEVDLAAALLQDAVKLLPRFGGVRRAVLHRYASPAAPADAGAAEEQCSALRDPFVLVTFLCPTAASEARQWLNSSGGASTCRAAVLKALTTDQNTDRLAVHTELVAEFAFFEPKKRRRATNGNSAGAGAAPSGSQPHKKARGAGGWGYRDSFQRSHTRSGGAGRKTKLGVRPSRNAAVAVADATTQRAVSVLALPR